MELEKNKAGLIYRNTVPGIFIRRINRFTAEVEIKGVPEIVHVKNTGRLRELLLNGAEITLEVTDNPSRKTRCDLISVRKDPCGWVNIDSLAPNKLVGAYLRGQGFDLVRPEFPFHESRLDFYMERGRSHYLAEVKGCTLKDPDHEGCGLFPDAPTARGVRHLQELALAISEGFQAAVLFVIQMNGIQKVLPNKRTDPAFGKALSEAEKKGVQVRCLPCRVERDRIWILDGASFY